MLGWGNYPSSKRTSGSSSSQYPGRRVHTPVEGSIRPSGSDYSRAQHLKSYVDDSTLQRSTRRVSAGTNSTYIFP